MEPIDSAAAGERADIAAGTAASLCGQRIDKYQVVRFLGRGGMGCVYEAVNTRINKRVAIKCIDHALAMSPDARARFEREAMAASAAESPFIVQIFDTGTTGQGLSYMVMELLQGEDLGSLLTEVGRLDTVAAVAYTVQILKGLHHAHRAGIVHRDLKPDNVFLAAHAGEPRTVKLLDFGVSKMHASSVPLLTLTREGTVVGTPYYMSPEQAQSFPDVDGRADLYSCGAILYECLCGRPPHVGQSYEQVIVNICMKDAEDVRAHNPVVPEVLAKFLAKSLARARDDRFQTARDMLDALMVAAPEAATAHTPLGAQLAPLPISGERTTPRRASDPRELADTVRAGTTPVLLGDAALSGAALTGTDSALSRRAMIGAGAGAVLVVAGGLLLLDRHGNDEKAMIRGSRGERRATGSTLASSAVQRGGDKQAPALQGGGEKQTTAPPPTAAAQGGASGTATVASATPLSIPSSATPIAKTARPKAAARPASLPAARPSPPPPPPPLPPPPTPPPAGLEILPR